MPGSCLRGSDTCSSPKIFRYRRLGSTMDEARSLATQGYPSWSVVVAEEQYSGRGRHGREWISPRGGLWASVILRGGSLRVKLSLLPILFGAAVARSIDDLYGVITGIKWPNDVYLGGRKIAGILIESMSKGGDIEFVVVGLGVNTNFRYAGHGLERVMGGSLLDMTGMEIDNLELLGRILSDARRLMSSPRELLRIYNSKLTLLGRTVAVRRLGGGVARGEVLGVDEDGAMLLREGRTILRVAPDEVEKVLL